MKRLEGTWLAFYTEKEDLKTLTKAVIAAIQYYNERTGALPPTLAARQGTSMAQHLSHIAQRLGLEFMESAHIAPKDFWLGPVEIEKER